MSNTTYQRKPGAVAERELGGTTMLVPVTAHLGKLDRFFNLNESAGVIWKTLADGASLDDVTAALCEAYDVSADEARGDAEGILKKLVEFGAIEGSPAP